MARFPYKPFKVNHPNGLSYSIRCGSCEHQIFITSKYCSNCGEEVDQVELKRLVEDKGGD